MNKGRKYIVTCYNEADEFALRQIEVNRLTSLEVEPASKVLEDITSMLNVDAVVLEDINEDDVVVVSLMYADYCVRSKLL